MQNIYLCDIDGTLACHTPHRGPYDEHLVHLDTALPTVKVIRSLLHEEYKVIFFSGRTDKCKEATSDWLEYHLNEVPELYMRKQRDFRSDDIVKEELYNEHIKGKYNVLGVFDDRPKVVRMWRKLGLFVFNCQQEDREF